tara:strand:- start:1317 stop:2516 length:1200 start_codon:yes stop_codon:yes gene_type:complete
MNFKIKFINHACFQIIRDNHSILVDPWFSGKVFNNSWALLEDTDIKSLDLSNLTHIFLSHEHPDHLNWSTLRKIREATNQKIEVFMPSRGNDNVESMMNKVGFEYKEFEPFNTYRTNKHDFSFSFFKKNHDSAIVFEIDEKIIFNKNDCEFSARELSFIKERHLGGRDIDVLFNQFSLAGYYGNKEDTMSLNAAKQKHITDLVEAHTSLNPKLTVPFASFIRFCRKENSYLNDYIVGLPEIIEALGRDKMFVPYYLEEIPENANEEKSLINCKQWEEKFKKETQKTPDISPVVSQQTLEESFGKFQTQNNRNRHLTPSDDFKVKILDTNKFCTFNFNNSEISFSEESYKACAEVSSHDLDCLFRLPWGADTMNITACFNVLDSQAWRKMMIYKDSCYVR